MRWEELTAAEFRQAAEDVGVCVLPMGVIEKHGEHLPLGTDVINAHAVAVLAAEQEPAIVFPPFYFGQVYEATCFPGTVAVRPSVLLELLEDVLAEIGRNGLKKIILYNGHGGNAALVRFLAQLNLAGRKDYTIYVPVQRLTERRREEWNGILAAKWGGHAHEAETSLVLAHRPDLVKMRFLEGADGSPRKMLEHLSGIYTGISWYADFPEHYSGDAARATAEKGKRLRALLVDTLAEQIRAVKRDEVAPGLIEEFRKRRTMLGKGGEETP